jgi:hypothetical protein
MIEVLRELSNSEKPWAAERAKMAVALTEQFQGGGLDEWEYEINMLKLIEDSKLDAEADDLETKSLLITAVHQVSGHI